MLPVKLYPATAPQDVRFHELDAASGRRIRHRRVVPGGTFGETGFQPEGTTATAERESDQQVEERSQDIPQRAGEPPGSSTAGIHVPYAEMVKGYEVAPGRYVRITSEELDVLRPERTKAVEVEEFVDLHQIDPIYFERAYYVLPQWGPEPRRAYALLFQAMERADRVAIGRLVLRTREHLAAIRPARGVLVLHTLFYADEVRDAALDLPLGDTQASERELRVAEQLIGMLAADWNPTGYEDRYRQRVLELIEAKARDQGAVVEPEEQESVARGVPDLLAALRASVEALKSDREEGTAKRKTG